MRGFLLKTSKRIEETETKSRKGALIIFLFLSLFLLGLFSPFNLTQGDFIVPSGLYISDSPDPFNPYFEQSQIEISFFPFFDGKGCDKLTLTIKGTGITWEREDTFGEVAKWDGRNENGNLVPSGNYLYEVVCDYTFNGQLASESATGTITVLPIRERFPYYQAETISRQISEQEELLNYPNYRFDFASLVYGSPEILEISPHPISLDSEEEEEKVLLAKIEFSKNLPTEENSGAGLRIKKGNKTYFLGFCTSPNCYGPHLFVSLDEGGTWKPLSSGTYGGWIDKNNNLFLWLKMKDIGSLPWLVDFLSGIVFSPTEYKPIYQSNPIELPLIPSEPSPQKWSFAIITDLHIGFDIPDYDGYSYNDASSGQDYYLSKRLEAVIRRINELKDDYNIKFVAVLGDISDTAEYSELLKARDILNKLNDPDGDGDLEDGIPYIPLICNHDVWPYTQKEGIDPDERGEENHATISLRADGDEYFEKIFWCSPYVLWLPWPNQETYDECLERNTNLKKIKEVFGNTFRRQEEMEEYRYDNIFLQNYAFSYRGINFISLDQIEIDRERKPGYYVPLDWNITQSYKESNDWFNKNLKQPTVVISHLPKMQWKPFGSLPIEVYDSFAGHAHYPTTDDNIEKLGSIITEAVKEEYKNVIRIVQVKDIENPTKEDIDYFILHSIVF